MMNSKNVLIAVGLSLMASGCSSIGATGENTTMYSVHQPVVDRTNYAIDVNVGGGNGLAASERTRVAEWFQALQLGYGDRIAIDFGGGYADYDIQKSVADLAAEYGMKLTETAPVVAGDVVPGTARIVVTRSRASVPTCPDLSKTTPANYNSANPANYGCATNGNLAAMIADPEDLVRGRDGRPQPKSDGYAKTPGGNQ